MNLRSNFPVGSPRWATRRTQWKLLGLDDEDLQKPKIAIVNSSSKLAPCFSHLDTIAEAVKKSIEGAGGVGFEIRTVAPTDFVMAAGGAGGYVLSSRDLLANDIEVAVEGAQLDGMVCLASCDKTTPGQLMAAGRLNIPTMIISCGYQSCGALDSGEKVDIEEVFLKAGHVASGGVTIQELCSMSDRAITSPGVCTGMGTANSMHIVAESLGMALTGSTPTQANGSSMWETVQLSGETIINAVLNDHRPRKIMTAEAFENAVKTVLAVSGSINCVKHLQAIARESGVDVDIYELFENAAKTIRPLTAVRPNGSASIEEFEMAGGAQAVHKQLESVLNTSVLTCDGKTLEEHLSEFKVKDEDIIRPMTRPKGNGPTLVVVRGTLAPDSAIVKLSVDEDRELVFTGSARTYSDASSAVAAIESGEVRPGEVLVLRGLGPVGTPGMGMASNVVFALHGAGLTKDVAIVTDGQLSGLVNQGIVVGEVSPEGAMEGPLGVVQNGDTIEIDVRGGRVNLHVTAEEILRRQEARRQAVPSGESGWLSIYRRGVEPLHKGATLRATEIPVTYAE